MTFGKATCKFVRTRRKEEVTGPCTNLRAVEVTPIIHRHRLIAGFSVHAPANMGGCVGEWVVPRFEIAGHQFVIGATALNVDDIVVFNGEDELFLQIPFECEIDVADVEDEDAVDAVGAGKAHEDTTRPVGECAGFVRENPSCQQWALFPC